MTDVRAKFPTPEALVLAAIRDYPRKTDPKTGQPYKGLHTVYSGLNQTIKAVYDVDPVEITRAMMADGIIVGHPAPGGFTIYDPANAPKPSASATLLRALGVDDEGPAPAARKPQSQRNGRVTTRKA